MEKKVFLAAILVLALNLWAGPSPARAADKAVGEQKVLVVMVKFPEVKPRFTMDQMRKKYFDQLDRYVRAVSYDRTWVTGELTDWYTLPQPVDRYRLSPHNLSVERSRVERLMKDALDLAAKDHDLDSYDIIFLSLGAGLQDYGMMGLCGYPGMLGWSGPRPFSADVRGVAIYCEPAHLGVVFHDLAHILGGVEGGRRVLPCLYDHDLQGQKGTFRGKYQFYLINVGYFDPMSCHFVQLDQAPPGLCAWSKLRLGWIEPGQVVEAPAGATRDISLGPLASAQSQVLAVKVPLTSSTYYLLENRQPAGVDQVLPAKGLLIYYCDDSIDECRHGRSPVKLIDADPSVPELKGAPFTLTGRPEYVDDRNSLRVRVLSEKGTLLQVRVARGR
ncbi:MAG: hypothetical protein AB1896_07115 [Thermodesulfobacteriota bacterium]